MQGSSGAPQDNTEKRISDDAAKTLQNILNAVRTSLEDEFAIQQMEYDEVYGVESEEFERYQIQVADWLRENKLVDAVVDMLPLSCFMNSPASAQQASPDPQQQQYQEPEQQEPQYQEPQYQEQQYQEQQQQEAQPQAPVHSYDEQSTSYVNMQPPPTSAEAPMPPAFAPPPPPEPEPVAASEQGTGWPEQPWGPPPGKPAEPEQQSSTMQGNPWAQSDDDSGWYTGAAPVETTQTQDVAGSDGEDASQWSQPQWNSSIEPASNQNDGFQSGGWAAVEEKPEPEPYTSAPPSPFAAPATVAEYESNSESIPESIPEPAPSAAPTPPPGWTALEPAQAPAPAPATGWGAPESAQTTGWAAPDQEPAPSWPPAPDLSSVPESASESAPTWPQAPEALPQPQPEPAPAPAPVFQSIPVSAAAPSPLPSPAPDQSVQQQPAPVPDPKKGEESEEDYTYDPTTAWG